VRDYVLTLVVAAAITYLLTPLVRQLAMRAGAMFEPRERDMHKDPVPRMGGLAMYGGLAAGLLVAYQVPQLRSNLGSPAMLEGLLLAGGLLVVVGMIDDRWGMSALTKAAGQIAAGAILVATGTQLNSLPEPGGGTFSPTPDQSALLTILVVVATINAVNFIDGLDGLAAGIVAIAAVSFLIYYYKMAQVVGVSELAAPALASALLTGVCLGFLPHNFHPARIFMGDTGAMLLGLVLAYAPISGIASLNGALLQKVNRYPEIMPLLLPAAILVIPYTDLLLAVIRRTRAGLSPFAADSKHLHHRLISIGHSQRASVLVMYLWAAVFSGSIVWFSLALDPRPGAANHHGQPVLVFIVITAAAVVALVLLSLPWLRRRDQPAKSQVTVASAAAPAAATAALAGAAAAPPPGVSSPAVPPSAVRPSAAMPPADLGRKAALAAPTGAPAAPAGPAAPGGLEQPAAEPGSAARSVVGSIQPAVVSGGKHSQNGSLFTSPDSHLGAGSAQQAWQAQADHPADPAAEHGGDRPAEPQADRRSETLPLPAMDVLGQRRE
jgi:UDP-GlcNAc:undecaprenyl-phosphate/decaprenyl-phosphate GlcNAc-1-phosphate transferase